MPTYEFECVHAEEAIVWTAKTSQPQTCPHGYGSFRRLWNFAGFHRKWGGGYSATTGGYAANEHQVAEALKAGSEARSEETGMEHRFKMADPRELADATVPRAKPKPPDVDKIAAEISRAMG